MKDLKIAVIGAGSTYTPELIEGFVLRKESLPITRLFLMDIDQDKLNIVGELAKRMLTSANHPVQVTLTTNLDEALAEANYVLAQIRVGGMAARITDEQIPLKYNLLGQETTGAGGFMNALRTVPVLLDIAKRMELIAPNAWLINFSNPSGIIAEALLHHSSTRMVGLCNNPINMLSAVEKSLGHNNFIYEYMGLNHLSWMTSVLVNGQEVISQLLKTAHSDMRNIPDIDYPETLLSAVPAIPCAYLSYYYLRDQQISKQLKALRTRGEEVLELEKELLSFYTDKSLHTKPQALTKRGGALYSTAAISLVEDIENNVNSEHVVNVLNHGAIPFMADDDAVEIKCCVCKQSITPIPINNSPTMPYIKGLMQTVKQYEKLTINAALTGNYSDALAALLAHPLVGDYNKAKNVLDEMLYVNKPYLPRFY